MTTSDRIVRAFEHHVGAHCPEEDHALRLLARLLVRAYLAHHEPSPQFRLDSRAPSNPSLGPMAGDDRP